MFIYLSARNINSTPNIIYLTLKRELSCNNYIFTIENGASKYFIVRFIILYVTYLFYYYYDHITALSKQ
jgi:hypothetical protein